MTLPVLTLRGVRKTFGTVAALVDVDLDAHGGEVHALLGENGAGKSTLMKVIYGLVRPDAGEISMMGSTRRFASPLDARRAGIGMVHQEFALVDALTVAENLAPALSPPGAWRLHREQVAAAARRLAAEVGLELGDLDAPVSSLPVGQRQRIEIIKALAGDARVLILDEPTAVLTPAEVRQLFAVLDRLRGAGTAVLFITHKLSEVTTVADRITVMRRGQVVARALRGELDEAALARAMVGPLAVEAPLPPRAPDAPPRLRVEALSADRDRGLPGLRSVSFDVHAGEVLGVAGVDGNGQAELFEVLTGLRRAQAGVVSVDGAPVTRFEPAALLAAGVACIPPDRQRLGVVAALSVRENALLNARLLRAVTHGGLIDPAAQRVAAQAIVDRYAIVSSSLEAPVASLSGGNVQKLIAGRALAVGPCVLIAANPTRGLDIAAAHAVYAAIGDALARGAGVVLISTDLDEIVARCHRVIVLSGGTASASLARPFDEERLGALLGGGAEAA